MKEPSPEKKAEWRQKASAKGAIVPKYFEVFPTRVEIICGKCGKDYKRPLIMNLNEPTFACPACKVKNWVPVTYDLK